MKHLFIFFIAISIFSCGHEKILQLPEINHSEITEIDDISAAYLFYDAEKDSIELNRKNLISTTNWLVNVDKRLTLKLVIPQIKFLQNKKKNASHIKEGAKNYYTCNDTSRKNLGFIEFTETIYQDGPSGIYLSKQDNSKLAYNTVSVRFNKNEAISIIRIDSSMATTQTNKAHLLSDLKKHDITKNMIYLNFDENLSFQEYISYKSLLENADLKESKISNTEFIFN
ncbi:hypothetical protein [Algibacter pacificus]|uniref:hypothetical protein n=1 Tax=Algibacter pacificus TaxID=2599389 RepID=UPI0011CBA80E|nr:hypothetical protein [Algibacter pacificus]